MNPPPSIPQPANHPPRCKRCNGAGWEPAEPIHGGVQGHPHTWTFVTPCTHDWWHDDTGWDPYTDDLLPWYDPRARVPVDEVEASEVLALRPAGSAVC